MYGRLSPSSVVPPLSQLSFGGRSVRTLDFDIEARPLSWYGGDWVTREVTAIAATFIGEEQGYVWLLGEDKPEDMLTEFASLYAEADAVAGHFIRGYDLPNLNAAMHEHGLPGLGEKWSVDTKLDLVKRQGLSNSQENLAAELGIEAPKVQMNQAKWRASNRLTPEGIAFTRERVIGDVVQHVEMLAELRRRGMVGPGKVWSPHASGGKKYTP